MLAFQLEENAKNHDEQDGGRLGHSVEGHCDVLEAPLAEANVPGGGRSHGGHFGQVD